MFAIFSFVVDVGQRVWTETPAKLWFICFLVGIVVELAFGDSKSRPGLRGYATNILHSLFYLAAIFLFAPAIWSGVAAIRDVIGMQGLINLQIVDNSTYLNQAVIFTIFLFFMDGFQYWWHRAQHYFPFLWDQHVVHHSDPTINVTTAVRHHWTEFMFQAFAVALPLSIIFNIKPYWSGSVGLVFGSFQFILHSNLKIHFGRWSWLVSSPGMHRIHHSILPEHNDKNFAAYFPIWDVIFGTYDRPKGELPPSGVAAVRHDTVFSLSTYPFVMWWRQIYAVIERAADRRSRDSLRTSPETGRLDCSVSEHEAG